MGSAKGRKSIFITGAASGMGLETARLFHGKGWFIGGYDVNADGLKKLEAELGADNCVVQTLDVTDKKAYEAAIAAFGKATDGKMDVLFNNAGIGRGGFFDEMPFEDVLAVVNVNFVGVLNGIYSAIGLLKATSGSLRHADPARWGSCRRTQGRHVPRHSAGRSRQGRLGSLWLGQAALVCAAGTGRTGQGSGQCTGNRARADRYLCHVLPAAASR